MYTKTNFKFTREVGFISYYEVCEKLNQGWTRKFNSEQLVPYIYGSSDWVGYEDIESLTKKVNKKRLNLSDPEFH